MVNFIHNKIKRILREFHTDRFKFSGYHKHDSDAFRKRDTSEPIISTLALVIYLYMGREIPSVYKLR